MTSTKPPPTLPTPAPTPMTQMMPTPPQSHGPALLPSIEGCEASRTTRGWQIKWGRPTSLRPPPSPLPATSITCRQIQHQHHPRSTH
ncbi:hypothetical protein BDZ94DRAFT_1261473 [Collybia nuda]|uniref:Uncharacterized protein n=1 Tax=Collybia nuda TaxID=64659 RepID=A0A9P5Y4E2_9AGAR|nr:hypothetical protein BDZ94DRAFT_1261473 [Collybia nuda]